MPGDPFAGTGFFASSTGGLDDSSHLSEQLLQSMAENKELQSLNVDLKKTIEHLEKEKAFLKKEFEDRLRKQAQRFEEAAAAKVESESKADSSNAAVSKEAARQRLRRLCQRHADGSLSVSEDIHEQWKAGGKTRDNLLKVLMETNLDKDCLAASLFRFEVKCFFPCKTYIYHFLV